MLLIFYAYFFACVWKITSRQCQNIKYVQTHMYMLTQTHTMMNIITYQFLFCIYTYSQSIIKISESLSHAKAT